VIYFINKQYDSDDVHGSEYKILVFCDVMTFTFIVINLSEKPASSFPKAED
jgi:hypothetical protein